MFSLVRRVCHWQLYTASLGRILDSILWFLGIQEWKTSVEWGIESGCGILARTDIHGQDTVSIEEATAVTLGPVIYNPTVEKVLHHGSTSIIGRLKPGVVLKSPRYSWWSSSAAEDYDSVKDIKHSFSVEEQILWILGEHPRIMKFLGPSKDPRGLLFVEANNGNLQAYIDCHNDTIDITLRMKWRTQATEAIRHLHRKGVIHSDLRPENYLLHTDVNGVLNLYLSDFGGSTCGDIDGRHLPDSGFFNPRQPWVSTEATDIFSLGSVFYTIMTGHWPYKSPGPFKSVEEKWCYDTKVDGLFSQCKFPTVEDLAGGAIIHSCWTEQYKDVESILRDQVSLQVETRNTTLSL